MEAWPPGGRAVPARGGLPPPKRDGARCAGAERARRCCPQDLIELLNSRRPEGLPPLNITSVLKLNSIEAQSSYSLVESSDRWGVCWKAAWRASCQHTPPGRQGLSPTKPLRAAAPKKPSASLTPRCTWATLVGRLAGVPLCLF
jgi:hypothetical protein